MEKKQRNTAFNFWIFVILRFSFRASRTTQIQRFKKEGTLQ